MSLIRRDLTVHQLDCLRLFIAKQKQYDTIGFITPPLGFQGRTVQRLVTLGAIERELPHKAVPRYRPTAEGRAVFK